MIDVLTERSGRVAAARKLTRRAGRDAAGLFLAEGRQAVSEALADPAGVQEVFATEAAATAHRDLLAAAAAPVHLVTEKAAAGLSETVTPQGLVAVCALRDVPASAVVSAPRGWPWHWRSWPTRATPGRSCAPPTPAERGRSCSAPAPPTRTGARPCARAPAACST